MPVTTSPTRSMYSSYIISRSASRIRWRITCFAVCAAMRPKFSGVTSARLTTAGSISDQSIWRSSSEIRTCDCALARLLDQPLLDVGRQLDREHAEIARIGVELDRRVTRGSGRLLVGGEKCIFGRMDQAVLLDPL